MQQEKMDLQPRGIAPQTVFVDPPLSETGPLNAKEPNRGIAHVDQPRELARVEQPSEVGQLIRIALEKGIDPKELYAILREERAARAKQAYHTAFAKFKAACPLVPRRHENAQFTVTRNGVKVPRRYAALEDIATCIDPHLSANGFSYRWDSAIEGDMLVKTCHLTHADGHSESSTVKYPVKSNAGCSEAQKYGSAGTYAARDSLASVTGVTSCDEDDDGEGGEGTGEPITEAQQHSIADLIIQVGADRGKFLKFFQVEKLSEIKAADFDRACAALNAKRKPNL